VRLVVQAHLLERSFQHWLILRGNGRQEVLVELDPEQVGLPALLAKQFIFYASIKIALAPEGVAIVVIFFKLA